MKISPVLPALGAAILFGASTPFAKLLIENVSPVLLAGLLYSGSGLGLAVLLFLRTLLSAPHEQGSPVLRLPRADWPWLAGAIAVGGMAGPVLLLFGLRGTSAASASLLLNVEGVLTAVIAWMVFKENADRRIIFGMAAIIVGGALLSWKPRAAGFSWGALLILAACLCWALDNNLTRKVSANDGMVVACVKGLAAGICNIAIALVTGASLPSLSNIGYSLILGFVGYGLSLTLFVMALRMLGTARTGAYFSAAPMFGVGISLVIWQEAPEPLFWLAAACMMVGLWLHITERHVHLHSHEFMEHDHPHRHDAHHEHEHDFAWDGKEPHVHLHQHEVVTHEHPHYPDIHHRHSHTP